MFRDPYAVDKFKWFVEKYKSKTVFETGTYLGESVDYLIKYFDYVITCEVKEEFFNKSCERFKNKLGFKETKYSKKIKRYDKDGKSIWIFWESSEIVMKKVFSGKLSNKSELNFDFPKPYLFYLDAHWDTGGHFWPIKRELKVIADFALSDSKIIIHDFKVPGYAAKKNEWYRAVGAWGYDCYGEEGNEQDLDYDFVKEDLFQINSGMLTFFNDKVTDANCGRGIAYCVPLEEQDYDEYLTFNRGKPPIKINPI